ncbi:JNK-interacting protein 1 isoform X2 [Cimex lectularius]|uniref:JNK-interacting protein 1 n=1 Tax=Cimex lectularius TaxID=79782 RepID=A0A8I6SQT8_CIMLE|nr:JNK-interacting protein 1 isoform X2 [Cimex lectularius]
MMTLVPDILLDEDSPTSTSSKSSDCILGNEAQTSVAELRNPITETEHFTYQDKETKGSSEDSPESNDSDQNWPPRPPGGRRRRKLPEIPKHKKPYVLSLADELGDALSLQLDYTTRNSPRNLLMLKYLRDEDLYGYDVDSGNSTAHSPDGLKSSSPIPVNTGSTTPASTESCSIPCAQLELLEATHRGLYKFIPRHRDELDVEIGDPIYVQKEADDLWCEGVNLRTGRQGVFPSAYVVDMDYNDFDPTTPKVKRERFLLGYLGSVETMWHKGTNVLCQAVKKIIATKHKPHQCILEISDQGLRMVDKTRRKTQSTPCQDYFYSLKNVSFCAFHPSDHRYMGFITKHPTLQRFACHVFLGSESTRPVAEAVGRAFQRFYIKFIETAYPIEDIYIE